MKPAFQKDDAFLADVRNILASGRSVLWWLGQSGFLVAQKGRALLLDPYLSDSLTRKYANTDKPHIRITERVVAPDALAGLGIIDVITSSHHHTDHLDAETLVPLLTGNTASQLVIPASHRGIVLARLGAQMAARLAELNDGIGKSLGDIQIHGIASSHPTVERDELGRCKFLGYVIRWKSIVLYHSGDTLWHDSLVNSLQAFQIDVALLPINGDRSERRVAGNLDGVEAARLAKAINARLVVPCHFDMFEFNTASPDEFVTECQRIGQNYRVLRNGERLDLPV